MFYFAEECQDHRAVEGPDFLDEPLRMEKGLKIQTLKE